MISKAYGGNYYGNLSEKRLRKSTSLLQLVRDDSGDFLAVALCRGVGESSKISAICSNGTHEGKLAVQEILKLDILEYDKLIWCETSSKIEHYYKKHGGYPIPNCYAAAFLGKPESELRLNADEFHYSRIIGESGKLTEKVIFGFRSKEIMMRLLADSKYEEERKLFNLKPTVITEASSYPKELTYASSFVEQLSDLTDENRIIEMSPQLSSVLDDCMSILKKYLDVYDWVKNDYSVAEYLREEIPVIRYGTVKEVIERLNRGN